LKRLCRGLSSGRAAARQGFALALCALLANPGSGLSALAVVDAVEEAHAAAGKQVSSTARQPAPQQCQPSAAGPPR
jgi:hypothetical protein